jgi:hypothetical protein
MKTTDDLLDEVLPSSSSWSLGGSRRRDCFDTIAGIEEGSA